MRSVNPNWEKGALKRLGSFFVLLGSTLFIVDSENHVLGISLLMIIVGILGLVAVANLYSFTLKLQSAMASILLLASSMAILTPTEPSTIKYSELTSFVIVVLVLMLAFDYLIEGLNALVINSKSSTSGLLVFNSLGILLFTYLVFLDFGETTPQQMIEFLRLKLIFLGLSMLCFNYAVVGQLPELKFLGQNRHLV